MDVSIVIPVFNQLHFTRICLESLVKTLPCCAEIIVIDNGSSDGTAEYLSGCTNIRLIQNEGNKGCATAWNQGVKAASSSWIAVLNNDIVLPANCFEGLLDFAEEKKADIVSPALREGDFNYRFEEYAKDFMVKMRNVSRMGMAHGIFFIVKERVFDQIGLFDENFLIGQFEDTDFFRRAQNNGFQLGITGRSFIHHFGSVTQRSIKNNHMSRPYEQKNRAYFHNKHHLTIGRRFIEKRRSKLQALYWRLSERTLHKHTLFEKWIDGRLHYF